MKVYIYERGQSEIACLCEKILLENSFELSETPQGCQLGIAPWLNRLIPPNELEGFELGVLVFHPSLLPIYRGRTAIKDAFKNQDKYSGATWFWANQEFDKGDICEQAVILINQNTPRDFYNQQVIPAAMKLLVFILSDLQKGIIRKRPQ